MSSWVQTGDCHSICDRHRVTWPMHRQRLDRWQNTSRKRQIWKHNKAIDDRGEKIYNNIKYNRRSIKVDRLENFKISLSLQTTILDRLDSSTLLRFGSWRVFHSSDEHAEKRE